jgi:hypothetical protein
VERAALPRLHVQRTKLDCNGVPPTFAYLLMFMIWVFVACLVWLTAGFMFLITRTRVFSRPLCFAMAGTFPFVFAYQLIAAPFVAALLLAAFATWKILEPGASTTTQNPLIIAVSLSAAFLSFGTMLTMSLAGFYEGWRTGWACAKGRRFQEVLYEGPTVKLLGRLLQKARSIVPPLSFFRKP